MGDISLDMMKDFYSLKPLRKAKEMTGVKISGRHLAQARADVYKPEFKLCKQKPTMRSPPTSPVGDYCSTGPRLEDLYDEMAQLELDPPGGTTSDLETASMKEEEDAHILENYSFDHTYAPELPITSYHQQIVDTIESNSVTVIQGATGSGKTTQVPQYILDEYTKNGRYCNIIVTQPRRIAAISIAKRVCQERGWTLGSLVGYQVARDKCVSEDTRLTYVTTGVLLQRLIQSKNMNQYTHVFLDEVHERDQDTDFSLLVVKKLLRTNSRHVKIVLMSATIESDLFSMYFAVPVRGRVEGAPVVSVEGKSFPVVECYLDQLADLMEFVYDGMPMPYNTLEEPGISPEGYQLAALLIKHLDQLEKTSNPKPGMPATRGTVLVFLPGIFEIKHMDQMLEDMCEDAMLVILPLHSQITNQEQSDVFRQAPEGYRKVILSTNIAESSITVPDIKYVIDFCLVKCLICDPETNFQSLRIQWSSKASSTQRKGRAGRVSSGTCFRMVTREFYESILPEFGIPEMQRCPLEQIVLQVKLLDIGPPKGILKLALQPPDIDDIEKTVLLLKQVGALSIKMKNGSINPYDGELTFVGKVLGSLPIDVHLGKLLVLAYVFGCLEECLVISASFSLRSFFNRPFKQELKAFSKKMGWADYSFSDCIAVLKAYKEWSMLKRRKGFPRGEVNWCNENFIQAGRIREVEELMKELTERLKQLNLLTIKPLHQKDSNSPKNLLILKLVICGAFYPNYFMSSDIDETDVLKTMSGHDPYSTVMVRNMPPHGATYRSAIARLFRPCGKGKALYFEETRGYIEFEKPVKMEQNSGSNFILPAVYMAIKMRHLRMPLNLFICEAKNARMEKLMQKRMEEQRMNSNRLLTSRVATSLKVKGKGSFEFDGGPQQVDLPQKGYIEIFTTEVIDAGHFWAQKPDSESATKLQHLQETINLFGGRNLEPISDTELSSGMFCLAFFNEDELFYRARIIGIERKRIQVLYLDFGNTAWLPFIQVRKIKTEFLNLPFQAFECALCEVFAAPSPHCPAGAWPPMATRRFIELTQNRKLVAKVYSLVRNVLRVDLYDTNTDEDIHLNQLLIDEGYAHFKEEPRGSKMARQRAESATGDNPEPDDNVNWLDDAVFEEEQNMQDELVTKVSLRGPESPLEMNFHCVTSIGQLRSTRIEQDSVNSVVLKDDLQDPHQRFMVAANIGINSSGRTVVARDTTLMPNIHGLFPLVSLIFAPFAELRTDPEKRQYTGALVGLGYDPRTIKPLLPDHDIELTFEVDITRDDIVGVNSIRTAINLAYHSEESIAGWGTPAVERIQNAAREMILELIFRKRENRKPCPFARPCRWNQIDPSYILQATSTEEGTAEQASNELYTMHNGIAISGKPLDEDEAAAKAEEIRQKVEWLKSLAGRVSEPFAEEVVCPICNVICRHPRAVSIHLRSPYHREEEIRLYED